MHLPRLRDEFPDLYVIYLSVLGWCGPHDKDPAILWGLSLLAAH